jgi:hypothetical protein
MSAPVKPNKRPVRFPIPTRTQARAAGVTDRQWERMRQAHQPRTK